MPLAPLRLLAVSGSLRAVSANHTLLQALALLSTPAATVVFYEELATLPAFNPDHDTAPAPSAVAQWRAALTAADAVVFSSPEYAHGVPGAFKNALDWVVGSGELVGKPTAVLNPSPRSEFAYPQLLEILTAMNAVLVPAACLTVALAGHRLSAAEVAAHPEFATPLRTALTALHTQAACGYPPAPQV